MTRMATESSGRSESRQPDFKWAVEYLVRERGQRRTAALLGVNRKTVALALRRERLTDRMNHAVQALIARGDDPVFQDVMPLDRMESQIRFLLDAIGELDDLIDALTLRMEALEEAQSQAPVEVESEADDETVPHEDEETEVEEQPVEHAEVPESEREGAGRRLGWWRR